MAMRNDTNLLSQKQLDHCLKQNQGFIFSHQFWV